MRWPRGVAADGLSADDERDLDDLGVGSAAMLLGREFHDGVRAVVHQPLEPMHLPLGVLLDVLRDVDVLALDDRPHS